MDLKQQMNHIDNIGTKFDQFLIAVNGALIAYSLKQIEEDILSYHLIPVFLAIIFWSSSFYFGIKSIKRLISMRLVEVFSKTNQANLIPEAVENKLKDLNRLANKNNKRMLLLMYSGAICFFTWQIIKMYLKTKVQ